MKIVMVRHAPTIRKEKEQIYGVIDYDVSLKSSGEVLSLCDVVRQYPRWISSPLLRARRTAEFVAKICSLDISLEIQHDFSEQNYGDLEGRPASELGIDPRMPYWLPDPSFRPQGGESFWDVADRTYRGLLGIVEIDPKRDAAIFCHGNVIRGAIARVLNLNAESIKRVEIPNWGYVVLRKVGEEWHLVL